MWLFIEAAHHFEPNLLTFALCGIGDSLDDSVRATLHRGEKVFGLFEDVHARLPELAERIRVECCQRIASIGRCVKYGANCKQGPRQFMRGREAEACRSGASECAKYNEFLHSRFLLLGFKRRNPALFRADLCAMSSPPFTRRAVQRVEARLGCGNAKFLSVFQNLLVVRYAADFIQTQCVGLR